MANRTDTDAKSIRGTNPQYLVEKIIRTRIYESKYWKEECFALTAELIVDKAMELRYIGGVHGGFIYPTPFLCLVLKMLQIQPEKDIVVEFIKNEEFKYVRALGAFYMRLTGSSEDCYKYLEPLYNDNRKLRRQNREGHFEIVHMDEFIDELLREERLGSVILPRIQKRPILEENNALEQKVSVLEDDLNEYMLSDDENADTGTKENKREGRRGRDRSRECNRHEKDRMSERSRSGDGDHRREWKCKREDRLRNSRERERDGRDKNRRERERLDSARRRDRGRY